MFLPVLLVREVGFWGWVVFALPNVIGAGAMGWVLRNAATSQRLAADHTAACAAFSAITIVFQITFAGWVVVALVGHWGGVVLLAVALAVVAATRWLRRGGMLLAVPVFLVSAAAFALAVKWGANVDQAGFPKPGPPPEDNWVALFALAPVCLFGFLVCPYLDLTFHQARQQTAPRTGSAAFAVGFGGPFLLMLVFTLWYTRLLAPLAAGLPATSIPPPLRWAIGLHMAVQLGYTAGVHFAALDWRPPFTDTAKVGGAVVGFLAGLVPGAVGLFAGQLAYTGLSRGEIVYRLFMAFYGLAVPAYAWLCMVPAAGVQAPPDRGRVRVFALAVIVAGPMYWMGFIERQWVWLVPGVAVVLLARVLVVRRRRLAEGVRSTSQQRRAKATRRAGSL
jgi:hypothetical protein